jgi:hypothetical protein
MVGSIFKVEAHTAVIGITPDERRLVQRPGMLLLFRLVRL